MVEEMSFKGSRSSSLSKPHSVFPIAWRRFSGCSPALDTIFRMCPKLLFLPKREQASDAANTFGKHKSWGIGMQGIFSIFHWDTTSTIKFKLESVQPSVFNAVTKCCNHHHYFRDIFIIRQRNPAPISSHSLSHLPQLRANTNLLSLSLWICLFWTSHIHGIVQSVVFCVWLLSLSIIFSKSIHVLACIHALFHLMAEKCPRAWRITFCSSIY